MRLAPCRAAPGEPMRTILIADDSTTIRKVVQATLGQAAFKVVAVPDGRQAVDQARALRPTLVLADVLMPELTGYEVAETLRAEPRTAGIPVLLLVGAFEPFDEERAARCGALGYLAKPFEPKNLLRRVEEVLARQPRTGEVEEEPVAAAELEPLPAPPETVVLPPGEEPLPVPAETAPDWGLPRVPLPGDEDFHLGPASAPTPPLRPQPAGLAPGDPLRDEVRRQVEFLAPDIIREVAWEIVPDLLERLLRESVPGPPAGPSGDKSR